MMAFSEDAQVMAVGGDPVDLRVRSKEQQRVHIRLTGDAVTVQREILRASALEGAACVDANLTARTGKRTTGEAFVNVKTRFAIRRERITTAVRKTKNQQTIHNKTSKSQRIETKIKILKYFTSRI